MIKKVIYSLGLILLFFNDLEAQTKRIDSLENLLDQIKTDTGQLRLFSNLSDLLRNSGDYNRALDYADKTKQLSQKLLASSSINKIGLVKINTYLAGAYVCSGNVHVGQGKYPEALAEFYASLKKYEELNEKKGIANSYNSIGIVLASQQNYAESLKQFFASLEIREKLKDKEGIMGSLNNVGFVNLNLGNYEEALKYHNKALELARETGNKNVMAFSLNNIGNAYGGLNNYSEALKNHLAALQIREELGSKPGVIASFLNIGNLYAKKKEAKKAIEYLIKANDLAIKIGNKQYIYSSYLGLSDANLLSGDHKNTLKFYKLYIAYRDSTLNETNTKKTVEAQMQYDFDKKTALTKIEQDKKDILAGQEKQKQKIIIWSVSVGLFLVLILAIVIFRSLRQNQTKNKIITEQKELVERQKELVEEKQKEILDSIHYARKIQHALITSEKYIENRLNKLQKG